MQITVAITSCGGGIIPGIINSLRDEPTYDFDIVGVDMNADAVGEKFTDEFYTVPGGLDDAYIPRMLEIAEAESIDVIVPLSDQETRSLSKQKDDFRSIGTNILTPDEEAVEISSDKGSMLEYLDENDVPVPEYCLPTTFGELDQAVSELGYPEKKVVVKPRRQRAARGFWMLSNERNTQDLVLNEKCLQTLPYEVFRELLAGKDNFPELVTMQYLAGEDYNVDCLSVDGQCIYQIPIRRIRPDAGPVQVGETVHDNDVQQMATQISDAFGFEYNTNIELAYPSEQGVEKPLVYEINPRVSGPIAVHKEAGVHLLLYGILASLGEEISTNEWFDEIRVHRCWQEIYNH